MLTGIVKVILPAKWASALVNGDLMEYSDSELIEISTWRSNSGLLSKCVSVSDDPYFSWGNDATPMGGDCLDFAFAT